MIYTIGHSNHSIDYFIEVLKKYGIETIVEVRSIPRSKYSPHFNKPNLIYSLSKQNIKYIDMGDRLGGRPSDQSVLTIENKIDLDKIEKTKWYQDAISRLIDISRESTTVIMCSEEDPDKCHRGYIITNTLLRHGEEVIHIRGDKTCQKAKYIPKTLTFDFLKKETA